MISAGTQFIRSHVQGICDFFKFLCYSLLEAPLMQVLARLIHIFLFSCGRHTCMSQLRTVWTCPRQCGITSGGGTLALGSSAAMSAPCSSWTNSPNSLPGLVSVSESLSLQLQLWPWLEVHCSQLCCVQHCQEEWGVERHKLPDSCVKEWLCTWVLLPWDNWNILDGQLSSLKPFDLKSS